MSVTFSISGERIDYDAHNFANFANQNARELLEWLGYETGEELSGLLPPGDLARRCERRLAPAPDNVATDLPRAEVAVAGRGRPTIIMCGSPAGSKRRRAAELLALAERAGDRLIEYG